MGIGIYNLIIPKGQTFKKVLLFHNTLILRRDINFIDNPIENIIVYPISAPLTDAQILEFPIKNSCNFISVIVNGNYSIGSENIQIEPYSGQKIDCNSVAKIGIVDHQDSIFRGSIKQSETEDSIADFNFNVTADNRIIMYLDDEVTEQITSNCTYSDIPSFKTPSTSNQVEDNYNSRIFKKGYYYDVEYENLIGEVFRKLYGRVFIPWEATR
jgi:hypothetical protein